MREVRGGWRVIDAEPESSWDLRFKLNQSTAVVNLRIEHAQRLGGIRN